MTPMYLYQIKNALEVGITSGYSFRDCQVMSHTFKLTLKNDVVANWLQNIHDCGSVAAVNVLLLKTPDIHHPLEMNL